MSRRRFALVMLLSAVVVSCAAGCSPNVIETTAAPTVQLDTPIPGLDNTPTDTPTPIKVSPATPPAFEPAILVRLVSIDGKTTRPEVVQGAELKLILETEPIYYEGTTDPSGKPRETDITPWPQARVTQMQVCISLDAPCEPQGRWFAYEPRLKMDPIWASSGQHQVWVAARFRDASGKPVPAVSAGLLHPQPYAGAVFSYTGIPDRRTQQALTQTAETVTAATGTAAGMPYRSVEGSILLADGRCCLGGPVGSLQDLPLTLTAKSVAGPVTEMRLAQGSGGCPTSNQIEGATWQPFVVTKTLQVPIMAINWIGLYLGIQYRDAQGNLSPVYCDDISVEGAPSMPTEAQATSTP